MDSDTSERNSNPKSQAAHQNQPCESSAILCECTGNIPTDSGRAQGNRPPFKAAGQTGFFFPKIEMRKNSSTTHFKPVDVSQQYLASVLDAH